jgi:uncharacterized protein with NAD-binding domain and iron-sulfur cluster
VSKQKIAILGGGVGAMTTAFHITDSPGWSDKYDITLYQMGWRLGGKGASGRNQDVANRIEEHGLHIWMGFYENAFRAIRQAYEECNAYGLTPGSPFTSWDKAFSPLNLIVLTEQFGEQWKPWQMCWPSNSLVPGVNAPDTPSTTWQCILLLIRRALEEMEAMAVSDDVNEKRFRWLVSEVAPSDFGKGCLMAFWPFSKTGAGRKPTQSARSQRNPTAKAPPTLLHDIDSEAQALSRDTATHPPEAHASLIGKIDRFRTAVVRAAEQDGESAWVKFDNIRRSLLIIDTALTIVRGVLADNVLERGFESIDGKTFTEWMREHGAWQPDSVLTKGMYDSSFAYRDGNPETPDFAAGTTLYGSLRLMFTYKGSIMWHMNAGMGDTIFSPLYLVLKKRGIKFKFFHKVTDVHLTEDRKRVGSIDLDVQVKVKPERSHGYDPLITVNGVPSWPNQPLYDQLVEGDELRRGEQHGRTLKDPNLESWWTDWQPVEKRTLVLGEDFDSVVMGISLGALPHICRELITDSPRWQGMVENVRVVRTQGLQIWLNRTREQVGWKSPYTSEPLLCAYYEPFDTWSDMTHLVVREDWPPGADIAQLAYFCNTAPNDPDQPPFSRHEYPESQAKVVERRAKDFIEHRIRPIWPDFQENAVVSQFTRLNIDPSEQYVQSVAGSTSYRLRSWESGYDNLVLAGDWTRTDVNIGCVEAATMSGVMASHAICGYPKVIFGAFGREFPLDKQNPDAMDALEQHLRGKRTSGR